LLAFSCGIQLILVLVNKIKHIKEFKWSFCSLLIIWCVLLGLINSNTMSFTTRKPDQWPNVRITLTKKRKIRFSRLELFDNSKYERTIFDIITPVNIRILLTKKRKMRFSRLELCNNSKCGRTIYGVIAPEYGINI
jgi:hypothetical protein